MPVESNKTNSGKINNSDTKKQQIKNHDKTCHFGRSNDQRLKRMGIISNDKQKEELHA